MAQHPGKKHTVTRKKAATHEVVGKVEQHTRIPGKWRDHYRHLTDLHSYLLRRKGDLVEDARQEKPTFSLHMADAGTDNYDQDFALSMISSEQNALYEIEQAITRIKDGTFGICEMTGKPIEPDRLAAIPWTRFSADAERELEHEGAVHRTQLGRREAVRKETAEEAAREESREEEEG